MKKKLLLLVAVALLLPGAAFADSTEELDFTGGVFGGTSYGFNLTNATLTGASSDVLGSLSGPNLGSVNFTTSWTGPWDGFTVGNVVVGTGVLPGGTFTITANGSNPALNGVLFTGSFNQGGTWTLVTDASGNHIYTLSCAIDGLNGSGANVDGTLTYTLNMGQKWFTGWGTGASSGVASFAVPEPGSLSLMGTGLLGLLGAIRRKMKK
jgi:hypothetical protein